jgi:hypothetical protein
VTGLGLCACHAATSLIKKDVGKRRHHYTNSRETLLITEQVAYDEKDLIL